MQFIQQSENGGTSSGVPVSITPTAGNILLAGIHLLSTTTPRTVSTIVQANVVWSLLTSTVNGLTDCEIWKGVASASPGTSATINTSGAFTDMVANVSEYSGVTSNSDFTPGGTIGTSTTPSTGTYTTATADDLVFVAAAWVNNDTPTANPAGFTGLTRTNVANCTLKANYQLSQGLGLQSAATWTIVSSVWATAVIGLKNTNPPIGIPPGTLSPRFVFFDTGQYSLGA